MAGSKISRSPTRWSYEKEVGDIYPKIVVGATGAVSSFKGAGVKSVVRNSVGNYTITLSATYQRLLAASVTVVASTITTVASSQVMQDPATLQAGFVANGTVTIQLVNAAGAAVDAPSGANILVTLAVRFNPSKVFD